MATTNFQLQYAVENWLSNLRNEGGFSPDDLVELKTHLLDSTADLQAKGLSSEEAFMISSHRLGDENEIAAEYKKVNKFISVRPGWVLMISGILLFLLGKSIWFCLNMLTISLFNYGYVSPEVALALEVLKSGIILWIIYKIFNSEGLIKLFTNNFYKNPVRFSFISVSFVGVLVFGFHTLKQYLMLWLHVKGTLSNGFLSRPKYHLVEYSMWLVPIGFYILLLYKLVKESNFDKRFSMPVTIARGNFLFFFLFGLGWEFLASVTRLLGRFYEPLFEAAVFGLIFFIGSYLVSRYAEKAVLVKLLIFSSSAIVFELAAGFFYPRLTMGTPLSVFAYFLTAALVSGYIAARFQRKKVVVTASHISP